VTRILLAVALRDIWRDADLPPGTAPFDVPAHGAVMLRVR
jgi:hypothetical protein